MTQVAFVAGATGYTGRELVAALRARGVATVAHVRPGSASSAEWRARFTALGATVDESPWEPTAIRSALARHRPTLVFALLGTTRARAAREGLSNAYETVDYGLSAMLLEGTREAARETGLRPRFVYLSAHGVSEGTRNPYLAVRVRVERELLASGLPSMIVRPAFITGPDRTESRTLERVAGVVVDSVLAVVGALGGRVVRARWSSLTGRELAEGMVRLALSARDEHVVVDPADIRRALGQD